MKATGIVRRIDELGRVVIPKEIRRTLRIREGDPLEIYTDHDGEVVLKKYSPIGEISSIAKDYTDSLYRSLGHIACICDRVMVVSASGSPKKELWERPLSPEMESAIQSRQTLHLNAAGGAQDAAGHHGRCGQPVYRADHGAHSGGRRSHRRAAAAEQRNRGQDERDRFKGGRDHRRPGRAPDGTIGLAKPLPKEYDESINP